MLRDTEVTTEAEPDRGVHVRTRTKAVANIMGAGQHNEGEPGQYASMKHK